MGANSSKTNNTPYTVYISKQRMLGAPGIPSLNASVHTEKQLMKAIINTGYMRLNPGQSIIGEDGPLSCIYFFNGYKLVREFGAHGRLLRVELFQGNCWNGATHNATNDYKIDGNTRIIHVVDIDAEAEKNATQEEQTLQRQHRREDRATTAEEYMSYMNIAVQIGTVVAPIVCAAYSWWKSKPSQSAPPPAPEPRRAHISSSTARGTHRRSNRAQNKSRIHEVVSDSESEIESDAENDDEVMATDSDIEEIERFIRTTGGYVPEVR